MKKSEKKYCGLRYFLILRLKTGIDEGNFNVAGYSITHFLYIFYALSVNTSGTKNM